MLPGNKSYGFTTPSSLVAETSNIFATQKEKLKVSMQVPKDEKNTFGTHLLAEVLVPLFLNDVDTCSFNVYSYHDRFMGKE